MNKKELEQLKKDLSVCMAIVGSFATNGEVPVEDLVGTIDEINMVTVKGHRDGTATLSCRLPMEVWVKSVEDFHNIFDAACGKEVKEES